MVSSKRSRVVLGAVLAALTGSVAASAQAAVVINEIYGGGGTAGGSPAFKQDFIELFNTGPGDFNLTGFSLDYGSAGGNFASAPVNRFNFPSGTIIRANDYLLIVYLQAANSLGANLEGDFSVSNVAMSSSNAKVRLVDGTIVGMNNKDSTGPGIVDLVGYGTGDRFETAAAPGPTTTALSISRNAAGADTNNNSVDFTVGTPSPRKFSGIIPPSATAALATTAVGTSLGTVSVAGGSGNFLIAHAATSGATSGSIKITGDIVSSANPILIYLDRAVDSASFPTIPGVTFSSGTYSFGTGVTYDTLVTYTARPTGTGDFFFNFSGLPAINNIAVVPEPSAALAALLPAGMLVRRRRTA